MIAKLLERGEGRVIVEYSAETPAEGMILGLTAAEQPDQRATLSSYSSTHMSDTQKPEMTIRLGDITLHTVAIIQAKEEL